MQSVAPNGIRHESFTRSCGRIVQYPNSSRTADTKTEGTQALVKVETTSPMMMTPPQITKASRKLYRLKLHEPIKKNTRLPLETDAFRHCGLMPVGRLREV